MFRNLMYKLQRHTHTHTHTHIHTHIICKTPIFSIAKIDNLHSSITSQAKIYVLLMRVHAT